MSLVAHPCSVPVSPEHLWELTADWVADGIAASERVLYFEDGTAEILLERLADNHVPARDAMADGQLVIVPTQQTRAALAAPVEALEALLTEQVDDTAAQGWAGLRLAGETGAALDVGGVRRVIAYERAVDRVLAAHSTVELLCRYDRRRFDDVSLAELRALHPFELVSPAVYDDGLLRVTRTGDGVVRLAGEVDHSNHARIRTLLESSLDEALRSDSAPTDITLDLSSLRFVDIAGAVGFVHGAEEFPSSHRLVLTGVRRRTLRVLDRCGAPFAAQLVIEPRPESDR